ncbi:MAG: Transcriptional regulator [Halomonas sp. HL-48]|nr:LysR family transcriptional regulator [Halomonas sp. HL-48]KPQ25223.1 MAG: Transcriptional regulator [Halomonas sp. HL-48]
MNIRQLTFRLLQVYVTVVRCGSVSEAARQLHLTQPTVSQQLKRLSEAVGGGPLLEHHAQGLTMTATGQALYNASRDVLSRFEDFADQLGPLHQGSKGRFSIALVNTAQYVLPRLLGPFSQAFPEVDVTVHIGNRRQLLARFERHEDDLYVFSHPPALSHAVAARFMRNPLVAIAAADHPLAQQASIVMEQLLNERLLLREPGSATRMLLESWLQEHGLAMKTTLQMASNEAIRVGVAARMGVAVLSEHVLPNEHPELAVLHIEGLPIESHWQFIVRNDQRLPQSAQRFLHYVDEHLDQWIEPRFVRNELPGLLRLYPTFPPATDGPP